jgi:geranylgeranyl reductase family protein
VNNHYPVAIVGAGPAGCMASMVLSKNSIPHLLIDKEGFPREKICGDGQTTACFTFLEQILPDFYQEMISKPDIVKVTEGFSTVFENEKRIDFKFTNRKRNGQKIIVCKRQNIDFEIFNKTKSDYAHIKTHTRLAKVKQETDKVTLQTIEGKEIKDITADLVIGADGERSTIAKTLGKLKREENGYVYSLRCYFENVAPYQNDQYLEFYQIEQILPGYFWIFPLPNRTYNVGFGMEANHPLVKERDLRELFFEIIKKNPALSMRFKDAKQTSKLLGWGIPFGKKENKLYGERFVLTGDAAQLANTVTGEGFSQALCSGKYAALAAIEALKTNDFTGKPFENYQQQMKKKIFDYNQEMERTLNFLLKNPLGKRMVKNISESTKLQEELSDRLPFQRNKAHLLMWTLIKSCF